jgi:hypothetical protein
MITDYARYMSIAVLIAGGVSCVAGPDGGPATDTDEANDSLASATPSQAQAIEPTDPLVDTDNIVPEAASDCPSGWFCLWQDAGFSGRRLQFQDAGCQNLTTFGFNDEMSSWFNRNNGNYRVYKDINCVTFLFTAQSGARASQTGFNDQASSICRGTGCP